MNHDATPSNGWRAHARPTLLGGVLFVFMACSAGEAPTGTSSGNAGSAGGAGAGGSTTAGGGAPPASAGGGIHAGGNAPQPLCAVPHGELDVPISCDDPRPVPLEDFDLIQKWTFALPPGAYYPNPPLVANLTDDDGDGDVDLCDIPDVLVHVGGASVHPWGNRLFLLSGTDGADHALGAPEDLRPVQPAIADLDNDGVPEILVVGRDATVLALAPDGSLVWESEEPIFHPDPRRMTDEWLSWKHLIATAFAVHDLDGDGSPEILVGLTVLDAQGNLLFRDPSQSSEFGDDLEVNSHATRPTVADLDGDGTLEVLFGYVTYNADGTERWRLDTLPGFAHPADFDGDGTLEVLFTNPYGVWLLTAEGDVLWGPTRPPDEALPPRVGCWVHPAAVADMDGDGLPEALINTCNKKLVAKIDSSGLTIMAFTPVTITTDIGAPGNGSVAYDFRGYGPDWVAHDHNELVVYAGAGGQQLTKLTKSFAHGVGIPVIADVDNDGSADVVMNVLSEGHIRVYEDYLKRFSPARRVWNQFNYSAWSVREDATIPASVEMPPASEHTYRVQGRRACQENVPAR